MSFLNSLSVSIHYKCIMFMVYVETLFGVPGKFTHITPKP